jgi:hypothetical protein
LRGMGVSGGTRLGLSGNGPYETRQFAGNGGGDDVGRFSRPGDFAVASA